MPPSNEEIGNMPMGKKLQSMVYVTFLLIGVGLLWPWNCILSATLFFQNRVFGGTTLYAKVFTSSMMTVSTLSSLLFNVYLERRQHSYIARVVRGLVWQTAAFVLLTLVSALSQTLWMGLEFLLIMALIAVSAVATAWTQNGIMAVANVFGPEFSQSVMMGQAVAGVLPSVVLFVVSIGKSDDPDTDQHNLGIYLYFLTTSLVSVACIWLFFRTQIGDKLRQMTGASSEGAAALPQNDEDNAAAPRIPFSVLFSKLRFLALSIITTFVVTLIFPVFAATTFVSRLPLSNAEYIPLVFTVWNVGDLYGRFIANWSMFRSPQFTPYKTFLYAVARLGFIPCFFYYTVRTRRSTGDKSVLVDLGYILLQFLFGLTNGHIISMSFMKVPESLETDQEKEAAGGFTSIFVSTGLAIGSVISYLFAFMIGGIVSGGEIS